MRTALLAIVAATVGLFARSSIDGGRPPLHDTRTPPPAELRIATLNFDSLAADVMWIRYIQNIPDTHADPVEGQWLGRQLTAVVDLDPHFRGAYLGGTLLLDVLADQPCDSLKILERGIRRFPQDWRMRFQAGFICFSEVSDSQCAVRNLRAAADNPDGPRWLPGLVGRLLVESSQTDAAIDYLKFELSRATDPKLQARFRERLLEATMTRDLELFGRALRTWRLDHGGAIPSSLGVLVEEGLVSSIPAADPFGGHYEIGEDGNVRSTSGRGELRAQRTEKPFYATAEEGLTEERVFARIPDALGRAPWLLFPVDRAHAASGEYVYVAQALEILDSADPDEHRTRERLGLAARLVSRVEVEKLQAAQLALLRTNPGRKWTLDEIRGHASVSRTDPFGDPYEVDANGLPTTHPRRRLLTLMNEGRDGRRACR